MTTQRTSDSIPPAEHFLQHRQHAHHSYASSQQEIEFIDNTMRVLLVEDNPIHAQFLKASLQRCHMVDVSQANGVQQALSYLKQGLLSHHIPSLILLDLDLPDGSALDVLQAVRNSPSMAYLPIIVLSSSDDSLCINACMKAGANAFMTKMLHPQQLHPFIQHTIGFWRHVQNTCN